MFVEEEDFVEAFGNGLLVLPIVEGAASGLVAQEEVSGEGAFGGDVDATGGFGQVEGSGCECDVAVGMEQKAGCGTGCLGRRLG